jgi:hypothetical protein
MRTETQVLGKPYFHQIPQRRRGGGGGGDRQETNLNGFILGLAHAPDVARLHRVGEDGVPRVISYNNSALKGIKKNSLDTSPQTTNVT